MILLMENKPRYKSESFIAGMHYTIPENIYMIHTSGKMWLLEFLSSMLLMEIKKTLVIFQI